MILQKEEANGALYQMSLYSTGFVPGESKRQRGERQKQTSEAKKRSNALAQCWKVMQIMAVNFCEMRDLFVCLTYAEAPENEGKDLEAFHKAMRKAMAKMGEEHAYIIFPAEHELPGCPVRAHFHIVMRGITGAGALAIMTKIIADCWGHGAVDVRPLRQNTEFFEDTVKYLLNQPHSKGRRAYSCSRNLKKPNEPLRLRLPDSEAGEVPPGVKVIDSETKENQYGVFRYLVGVIVDRAAFDAYWTRQKKRAAPDPWERIRRRRRRLYNKPASVWRC